MPQPKENYCIIGKYIAFTKKIQGKKILDWNWKSKSLFIMFKAEVKKKIFFRTKKSERANKKYFISPKIQFIFI